MNKKYNYLASLLLSLLLLIITPFAIAKQNFEKGIVVSKNEMASRVGSQILEKGGNAVDAAIATGYALGVVEPNSTGIGGGGFALIYLVNTKELKAVDFRERAPRQINRYPYEFRNGPKSGGIPGTVAGFEYLRKNYGRLDRKTLILPAIKMAREGIPVNKIVHTAITRKYDVLKQYSSSRQIYLLPDGQIPNEGYKLRNSDLAKTMEAISKQGADGFYKGELAKTIASGIQSNNGLINYNDLRNYKVLEWTPICGTYRNQYKVCSFPPPSSGGVCILEALNILENFNYDKLSYNSPERLHYLIEALKFSFADRATKLGDPRFNHISTSDLISREYAQKIAERIRNNQKAVPGGRIFINNEKPETTHITVVDKDGNIAAITSSLNGPLGSGFVIPGTGIVLNNTLDDFSLPGSMPNQFGLVGNNLNLPAPYKTPLSSMSPTIVFDNHDRPILAIGSPGGPTIISAVINTLTAYLDYKMPIKNAVSVGRLHHQWQPDLVFAEKSLIDENAQRELRQKYGYLFPTAKDNYIWNTLGFYWFVQAVELDWGKNKLNGASDPRAEQGLIYETP